MRIRHLVVLAALASAVLAQGAGPKGLLADLPPEANESHLYSTTFSADGKTIVSVLEKKIHVWDTATWKQLRAHGMKQAEQRLACAPDGKTYAWNAGNSVDLVDAESGDVSKSLDTKPEFGTISNLTYAGKTLVAAGKSEGHAVLWLFDDAGTHKVVKGPEGYDNFYALAASSDGKMVACGMNSSAEIHVFDLESAKEKLTLSNGSHLSKHLAFSPDGKLLASCGFEEPVRVFDLASGKTVAKLEMNFAACVAFSPADAKVLAASSREQFVLFDVTSRLPLAIYGRGGSMKEVDNSQGAANGPEGGMAFSPDGKRLAWGCEYEEWGHVRVWDVAAILEKK